MKRRTLEQTNQIIGTCPDCGPNRWATILKSHTHTYEEEYEGDWAQFEHQILQCAGCDSIYFQSIITEPHEDKSELETIVQWEPTSRNPREEPDWLPSLYARDETLGRLMKDIYTAFNRDLNVFVAIGVRTAFDRASELLDVDPGKSFHQKMNLLNESGHISNKDKSILSTLTDAGSAAAHRAWRPSKKDLIIMLMIIENFLHKTFVLDEDVQALKGLFPERNK